MIANSLKRALLLGSACVLAGCATSSWHHRSKGLNEFNQEKYTCIQQSAQSFPVVFQQQAIGTGYTSPAQTNCTTFYGQTNCTTTPGTYRPPASYNIDINQGNRNSAFNACMGANGWYLQRDK